MGENSNLLQVHNLIFLSLSYVSSIIEQPIKPITQFDVSPEDQLL